MSEKAKGFKRNDHTTSNVEASRDQDPAEAKKSEAIQIAVHSGSIIEPLLLVINGMRITVKDGVATIETYNKGVEHSGSKGQTVIGSVVVGDGAVVNGNISQSSTNRAPDTKSTRPNPTENTKQEISNKNSANPNQVIENPNNTPNQDIPTPYLETPANSEQIEKSENADEIRAQIIKNEILIDSYSNPEAMIRETENAFEQEVEDLQKEYSEALLSATSWEGVREVLDSIYERRDKALNEKNKFISQLQSLRSKPQESVENERIEEGQDDLTNEENFPYNQRPPKRLFDRIKGGFKKVNSAIRAVVTYPNRPIKFEKFVNHDGKQYWDDSTFDKIKNSVRRLTGRAKGFEYDELNNAINDQQEMGVDDTLIDDQFIQDDNYQFEDEGTESRPTTETQPPQTPLNPDQSSDNAQNPTTEQTKNQTKDHSKAQTKDQPLDNPDSQESSSFKPASEYNEYVPEFNEGDNNFTELTKEHTKLSDNLEKLIANKPNLIKSQNERLKKFQQDLAVKNTPDAERKEKLKAFQATLVMESDKIEKDITKVQESLDKLTDKIADKIQQNTNTLKDYLDNRREEIINTNDLSELLKIQNRYDDGKYETPNELIGLIENLSNAIDPITGERLEDIDPKIVEKLNDFNKTSNFALDAQFEAQSVLRQKIETLSKPFALENFTSYADKDGVIMKRGNYTLMSVEGKLIARFQKGNDEPIDMTQESGDLDIDEKGRLVFRQGYEYNKGARPVFWINNVQEEFFKLANQKAVTRLEKYKDIDKYLAEDIQPTAEQTTVS